MYGKSWKIFVSIYPFVAWAERGEANIHENFAEK
jgi:hypothetical protein